MAETIYCTFCTAEATHNIHDPDEGGVDSPACKTCADVFLYGQACAKASVTMIEPGNDPDIEPDNMDDDLCDICRRSGVQISHIDDMGNAVCYECTGVGDE